MSCLSGANMEKQLTEKMEKLQEGTEEKIPCNLCHALKDPTVLPCQHSFCRECLEKFRATEPVVELSCAVCSSYSEYAPLPQNGDEGESGRHSQSKFPTREFDITDGTNGSEEGRQQHQKNSQSSNQQERLEYNLAREELLEESKLPVSPGVGRRLEAVPVTEGKTMEQSEDVEYFLCLNNSDVKNSAVENGEKELLTESTKTQEDVENSQLSLNNSESYGSWQEQSLTGSTFSDLTDVSTAQEEEVKQPHGLDSEESQPALNLQEGQEQGGLSESSSSAEDDMAALIVTNGQPSEQEHPLNHQEKRNGSVVTPSDQGLDEDNKRRRSEVDVNEDVKKQRKESLSSKKGKCKCPRGDPKAVHCSVCQKYVCLHCATHDHKNHSPEEIQEALDKEKTKIQHGLDLATTCAESHRRRLSELADAEGNLLKQFENMSIKIAEQSDTAFSLINERVDTITRAIQEEAEKARSSVRNFKEENLEALLVAFEERREKISEQREAAQVAFAAASSYSNISRKILDDGSSAVVLTSSNSLAEVLKTLPAPGEKIHVPDAIPAEYDRRLWFIAPEVDLSREVQKCFGKIMKSPSKQGVAEEAKDAEEETKRPSVTPKIQKGPTLITTLKSAMTQLHRTFSVAADDDNDIIVAGQNIVRIFNNETLRLKNAIALAFNPEGLAAYGDEIFVTGNGHNIHVLRKTADSRRVLHVEGVQERLQGLAVDRTGRIIVTEDRQVFVLLSDGTSVCTFEVASEGGPVRLYPATNSSGEIIISDEGGHTVKVYDAAGSLLRQMGGKGKDDGQLLNPAKVCTDGQDNIIVADTKNNRVCQFLPDGTFDRHLLLEEHYIRFPWGVAVTSHGRLVVSSLAVGQAVRVYDLHKNS